ncbi:hypothetical protein HJFPF1_06099 [Paramyrothecium foliicola]|nr:hypothetical protein HJFPF1_06099 [Paramyrothecium foliicola]
MASRLSTLTRLAPSHSAPRLLRPFAGPTTTTTSSGRLLHTQPALRFAAQVNDNNEPGDPNRDRKTADVRVDAQQQADGDAALGRTGGGKPLESSSRNAPAQPKVDNFSTPGDDSQKELSEEQKKEVDEHNKEFDKRHDRGNRAPGDKVDKKFWAGTESRK